MGLAAWYAEAIVPRFIKCACGSPQIMKIRQQIVPQATGRVLELGCGGGINQACYIPANIESLVGLDPSAKGLDYARQEAQVHGTGAQFLNGSGESIPADDAVFDCVVCTFTLCTVQSAAITLREVRRVLKPGGKLLFAEHGLAPDPATQHWQRWLEPAWKRLAGGCHLTRTVAPVLSKAGFEVEVQGAGYMPKTPRFAGWVEWGTATRTS